jgi:hypothetical protein
VGGPEVSFLTLEEAQGLEADVIVSGEGERVFPMLLEALEQGTPLEGLPGVTYREGDSLVVHSTPMSPMDMDELRFAYTDQELVALKGSILYYESSRGCPFHCAYCMSSVEKGLRMKNVELVKKELVRFMNAEVGLVKFVDRTFNCHLQRTKELLQFLLNQDTKTCFHFEVAADLLDEEIIDLLGQAPLGRFQIEAGVQSIHPETLKRIHRSSNIPLVKENLEKVLAKGNVHVHMDLIAGLPGEGLDQISTSFDDLLDVRPHMLQLGFLKLLKGSPMMEMVDEYGYGYRSHPPYQVLFNNTLTYQQLRTLEKVEHLLDRYYNSGAFATTLMMVDDTGEQGAFDFYVELAKYWEAQGGFDRNISRDDLYRWLMEHLIQRGYSEVMVFQTLKVDYLIHAGWPLPRFLHPDPLPKEQVFSLLHQEGFVEEFLPEFSGSTLKETVKRIHMERFDMGRNQPQIGLVVPIEMGLKGRNVLRWVEDSL